MQIRVGIILVTYNRLSDLKNTLLLYGNQTKKPEVLLVVDNNSTDGTQEYLCEWEKANDSFLKQVLYLPRNVGGSGGFAAGMKKMLEMDVDWIFVADDDAIPHRDMLERLLEFVQEYPREIDKCSAICTAVNNNGSFIGIHRCRIKKGFLGYVESYVPENEYNKPYFYIDIYSFVGTMIKKKCLQIAGVARDDFFIYNDDYEHAVRVGKEGTLICVPAAVMDHVDNLTYTREATWRDYYSTRNAIIMHLEHFGKWAGAMRAFRRILVALASLNPKKMKVISRAIIDAYLGRTGIHPIYKPGWSDTRK